MNGDGTRRREVRTGVPKLVLLSRSVSMGSFGFFGGKHWSAEQKTIPHRYGIVRATADFEELAELTVAGQFKAIVGIVGQTGLESLV